jgi:hypothetical protein
MSIASCYVKRSTLYCRALCFLLAATVAVAQDDAQALVSRMVANELASQEHPHYWMYLDHQRKAEKDEVNRVLQMPQCWLIWPVSINGRVPTEEERKRAQVHLERLLNNSEARKKNREEIDADAKKSATLLKMLPEAFLFTEHGQIGESLRLTFLPNPQYRPSSNEAKVFHNMRGELLIDAKRARLARLSGELISDVDFGWGILGRLQKGGTFEVEQSQVASSDWEMSLLNVHISGRALFFHTIGEQQHQVRSQFEAVPSGLNLAQAVSMISGGRAQGAAAGK